MKNMFIVLREIAVHMPRTIRLALYEILYDEEVPEKVAINEAVELAKKFGGDESPSFVNGILARLVKK